jgi:glycosyltransferase involved in cell wall biosynthesis
VKKRILYIGNKLSKSGNTVTSIETLGSFLKNEGYKVVFSSSKKNKVLRLLDMLYVTLKYSKKVSCVLIDTYSTQNFFYAVLVAKLCRILDLPYIPILRGGILPERLKKSPYLCNKLFGGAKLNVAPSMFLYEVFSAEGYTNLKYIPNTIEMEKYTFLNRNQLKANFLWVRSFSKIYNPLLAIEIVERLMVQNIEVRLCMIGPDKDGTLKECQELVSQKKLPVTFTGKLSKEDWIKKSRDYDIFINTTNFDNTPVSVIEAMALGLPVVSTNVGGIPYLIDDQQTGILVAPNQAELFVAEIIELLNHPKKATVIAENARKQVEQIDWEIVKEKWNDILSEK